MINARWQLIVATALVAMLVASFAAIRDDLSGAAEPEQAPRAVSPVQVRVPQEITRALQAPLPIRRRHVGRGANSAVIAYRGEVSDARPLVVFLHGWGLAVRDYRAWIDHLVRRGATVIAPRYQTTPRDDPAGVREAARRSIQRGLREVTPADDQVVLAGHSAGGALAADLAADATRARRLPTVRGVLAVYPGRAIRGYPGGIPAAPPRSLPPQVVLRVLASATDSVVGEAPARAMIKSAANVTDRSLIRVTDPSVADHLAPLKTTRAARRAFWGALDRLVFGRRFP